MPLPYGQLSSLSEDFKPPQLLFRDCQLSDLSRYVKSNYNVWAEGDPGLGKTVTCRIFADEEEYRGEAKTFFIKCRPSMKDAAHLALRSYGIRIPRLEVNGGRFALEIISKFADAKRYLILMDEPEKVRVWWREVADFVHSFWNEMKDMSGQHKSFNIIFMSQLPLVTQIEKRFPDATLSRLQLKPLIFGIYPEEAIIGILKQRLQFALPDKTLYSDPPLEMLAHHIYRVGGNIREALDLLEHAILTAEETLTKEVMAEAIDWGKNRWWTRKLLTGVGSPHTALMLYLAAELSRHQQTLTVDCPHILRTYKKTLADMEIEPLSTPTLYESLRNLVADGFFTCEYEKEKAFYLKLTFTDEADRNWIVKIGKDVCWSLHLEKSRARPSAKETPLQIVFG